MNSSTEAFLEPILLLITLVVFGVTILIERKRFKIRNLLFHVGQFTSSHNLISALQSNSIRITNELARSTYVTYLSSISDEKPNPDDVAEVTGANYFIKVPQEKVFQVLNRMNSYDKEVRKYELAQQYLFFSQIVVTLALIFC